MCEHQRWTEGFKAGLRDPVPCSHGIKMPVHEESTIMAITRIVMMLIQIILLIVIIIKIVVTIITIVIIALIRRTI